MGKIAFIIILLSYCSTPAISQCSDAGICTIGSHQEQFEHVVSASYVFGKSGKSDDLTFHTVQLEGTMELLHGSRLSILLPFSRISGPLGNASGVGDLTLIWNQAVSEANNRLLSVQIGGKIATGEANTGGLPQPYQPGLGTNDLLVGITYSADPWLIGFGYQLSRGRSANALTRLKRGDDMLARIGYTITFQTLGISFEALAIKRLTVSNIADPALPGDGSFVDVSGTDQLQFNLLSTASFPLSDTITLRGLAAVPLRSRSVNVDGLTRSLSLGMSINYSL